MLLPEKVVYDDAEEEAVVVSSSMAPSHPKIRAFNGEAAEVVATEAGIVTLVKAMVVEEVATAKKANQVVLLTEKVIFQ